MSLRGFMLADSSVFDQAEYDLYRAAAWPSIEAHGGTFMIRGGRFERLEGTHAWNRLIGLEFPGLAELRTWYSSPAYQALKAQRLRGARTDMVFLEETGKGGGAANPAAAAPDAAPPAYVIADIAIHDLEAIRGYSDHVAATHAKAGARYLSRGGAIEVAEGEWRPERLVLIEFPSWDAALGWYRSDEYQALRRIRESCARTEMVLVEGYRG